MNYTEARQLLDDVIDSLNPDEKYHDLESAENKLIKFRDEWFTPVLSSLN